MHRVRDRLRARSGAEVQAAAGVRGAPVDKKVEDAELAGDDLEINEDAEPSADEEVDLDTGDSDLGVETETKEDEN